MIWVVFIVSSVLLVLAAVKLAEYSDVIAIRTGLGRLFIGTLLLAGATSLPEFLNAINSLNRSVPDLAAGDMFGSNMLNIFLLGLFDVVYWRRNILVNVANKHVLATGFAILLVSLAVFFVQAHIPLQIGWLGIDSLVLITIYLGGVYFLQQHSVGVVPTVEEISQAHIPRLGPAIIGFTLSVVLLVMVSPRLVESCIEIAHITGLGTGFIGVALVGLVTSLPEVVTCISAIRLRAYDLAVGNLLGSVIFNMFALGIVDLFATKVILLRQISPEFGQVGMISLVLLSVMLVSNTIHRRRARFKHFEALIIIVVYALGIFFISQSGLGG